VTALDDDRACARGPASWRARRPKISGAIARRAACEKPASDAKEKRLARRPSRPLLVDRGSELDTGADARPRTRRARRRPGGESPPRRSSHRSSREPNRRARRWRQGADQVARGEATGPRGEWVKERSLCPNRPGSPHIGRTAETLGDHALHRLASLRHGGGGRRSTLHRTTYVPTTDSDRRVPHGWKFGTRHGCHVRTCTRFSPRPRREEDGVPKLTCRRT
jgi:hypothetical protein